MQNCVRYLTHPQVQIDPAVPVPLWTLSAIGRKRVCALARAGWLFGTTEIIASGEPKALETAEILAAELGLAVTVKEAMHENDRSATGFLPPAEFEVVANEFFATPTVSVRGWEPARAAQQRIVREMEMVLEGEPRGDILVVGHGAVGTLLLCHYSKISISRAHDQPVGGGNYFTFLRHDRRVLHFWWPMEISPLAQDT
jgi:broad specificity phosphatase PhoE